MKREIPNAPHRRQFLKGIAGGAALISGGTWAGFKALAQNPPSCPTPPAGGTVFKAGQDTRPIVERLSISKLSSSQLAELQKAFAALRALPSTDPRTWILQADLHALFCDQCSDDKTQIHGTWSFFPWHRAYLYFFERILGSLVNDLNNFRLPFWDWENYRSMPSPYRLPASTSNSLYDPNRYSVIASGGNLPSSDGTTSRIKVLDGITDFATFGGTATSGGACESNPHDLIHDDVGLQTSPWHDMGNLGYASRDPIFFAHHANLDKLWYNWNALSSSHPGEYENPTDSAFLSLRWSFYDYNKQLVSISAADVLNFTTNLRYSYPTPVYYNTSTSAAAPEEGVAVTEQQRTAPEITTYSARLVYSNSRPGPIVDVTYGVKVSLIQAAQQHKTVLMVLRGVTLPEDMVGAYDVVSVHGNSVKHLGSVAVVGHDMHMHTRKLAVVLDATEALEDLFDSSKPAFITLVARQGGARVPLNAEDIELRVLSSQ